MNYLLLASTWPIRSAALSMLLCLSACSNAPMKIPVVQALPAQWEKHQATATTAELNSLFLPIRQDSRLIALLKAVKKDNFQFATALNRLRRARLQTALAENSRLPQPAGTFGVSRQKQFGSSAYGSDGASDGGRDGGSDSSKSYGGSSSTTSMALNFSLTYEADLWNRLGAERDVARWEQLATAEDVHNVRIGIMATAVTRYYQIAQLNEQIKLVTLSLENAKRTMALVEAQYQVGTAAAVERAEARQTVANRQATYVRIIQQRTEALNSLAGLLDGRDITIYESSALPDSDLTAVPGGLPTSLLAQRPDLHAAELRLRRLDASIAATRASFYPPLILTVTGGGSSEQLNELLRNPVGTISGTFAMPFLNISKARLTTSVARVDFDIAASSFQQTMLDAFLEVANLLAAGKSLNLERTHLLTFLADARLSERLYESRYRAGAAPLKDWLNAQDKWLDAQIAVNSNMYAQLVNRVTLLKALGMAADSIHAFEKSPKETVVPTDN